MRSIFSAESNVESFSIFEFQKSIHALVRLYNSYHCVLCVINPCAGTSELGEMGGGGRVGSSFCSCDIPSAHLNAQCIHSLECVAMCNIESKAVR